MELAIRDARCTLPEHKAGDIWLRSLCVFKYRSGADPDIIWRDDWLSIGVGYLDPQGYLYLKGGARAFQVADQTVYPEAIEANYLNILLRLLWCLIAPTPNAAR